jgi:hypothetical protein
MTTLCCARSYPLQSAEAQTRQLADLAFVLQHYAVALANYRAVATEYRDDRALRHLGSAQARDHGCCRGQN